MSQDPPTASEPSDRPQRIRQLVKRFHHDTLTVREAKELMRYIERDLQKARDEGNLEAARLIERYRNGIESYIALREGDLSDLSAASGL